MPQLKKDGNLKKKKSHSHLQKSATVQNGITGSASNGSVVLETFLFCTVRGLLTVDDWYNG